MNTPVNADIRTLSSKVFGWFILTMVIALFFGLAPSTSYAQTGGDAPPAGEQIQNQATATYTDNNGNNRTAESNVVTTVVQQVYSVTITDGITKNVGTSGEVTFNHTITNTGNGTDNFAITVTQDPGDFFSDIAIYAAGDVGGTDLSQAGAQTPDVDAGEALDVVVQATVSENYRNDEDTGDIEIAVESVNDASAADVTDPRDAAIMEYAAVVNVAKEYLNGNGAVTSTADVGETVTVRFSIDNSGSGIANNLNLTDELPAGMEYVEGSAIYQSSARSDASDSDDYTFDGGSSTNGTITLNSGSLAPGATAVLTFDVVIAEGYGGNDITNTADFFHDDLGSPGTDDETTTATLRINDTYSIVTVDDDGNDNDETVVGSVAQGGTVNFVNTFRNASSTSDSYEIELSGSTFPANTTFEVYRTDGSGNATSQITTDSDNDGNVETATIPQGETFEILIRANLPVGARGDNSGAGYKVTKTLTSAGDNAQTATFDDRLEEITASVVDVTDTAAAGEPNAKGEGVNGSGEAEAVTTKQADPSSTVSFSLFISNESELSDNYNLAASTDNSFGSTTLPAGWTVDFQINGASVTNTGTIPSGDDVEVTAVVTLPSDAAPQPQSIFFRALSPQTGAADVLHNAVTVNPVRSLILNTDHNDEVAPGGSVIYAHTLTNTGNVLENDPDSDTPTTLKVNLTQNQSSGFQSVVFLDMNEDGQIDSGDIEITGTGGTVNLPGGTLASGASVKLLVRVSAGTGVQDAVVNVTTLTIEGTGVSSVSNINNTEVTAGKLSIEKSQSLSGDPGTYVDTNLQAEPGKFIYYKVVVTNTGSAEVTGVELTDQVQNFTSYVDGSLEVTGDVSPSAAPVTPNPGGTGLVKVSVAQLNPSQSFAITFAVKIDGDTE